MKAPSSIAGALVVFVGLVVLSGWIFDIPSLTSFFIVAALALLFLAVIIGFTTFSQRKTDEEKSRFFNLSLDLLCTAGFDGYFKDVNPQWEKSLGWTQSEMLEKPYFDWIHPEDRQKTGMEAEKLSHGLSSVSFENRYRCKDGSYKWLQWNASPLEKGQRIYAAARDVTRAKEAELRIVELNKELEQRLADLDAANKELEAFCYSVSHDLRAPLRSIDGFSLALLEDCLEQLDDAGKAHLERIRASARQMGQLIDDMLELTRVARSEMRRDPVDLSSLAREVAAEVRKADAARQVTMKVADGLVAEGDSRLLRVVLDNLLRNAWKFTGKHDRAHIEFGSMSHNGDGTVFFVRDDGAGFDMAHSEKLFGVFQRLHLITEFPGTGIGLATVQRIIHRHGGRVWAEGQVEKGATVYFTLSKGDSWTKKSSC